MVRIEYLADHLEHLPRLAEWFHAQWGYLSPGDTLEKRSGRLRQKAQREGIPVTFVALDRRRPVGSASLVVCDMDTRAHLTPWMASVYVDASFRNRGIGSALVKRVLEEASRQGAEQLYLWTPDRESFYRKRGWRLLERTRYRNENASVMEYALTGPDGTAQVS
jgi:N-acetylglutamate synthase-like GNAT family acetyltransferase